MKFIIPEHYEDDTDLAIEAAQKRGERVVLPKEDELQLDLDDDTARLCFESIWPMFGTIMEALITKRAPSKGGKGEHVTIKLPFPLDDMTRVFFQALLGSDPKRELFGFIRIQQGITPVSLFFEKE